MDAFNSPLQVVNFIATRKGDADRGPLIRMNGNEAGSRLLQHGEMVWVYGPRRMELATLEVDDEIPRGEVIVRDIAGITVTEIVRVRKPDFDRAEDRRRYV